MDIPFFDLLSLGKSLLDLVDFSVNSMVGSLLGYHDSESLEIREILLRFAGSEFLGPCSLLESFNHPSLLDCGLNDLSGSATTNFDLQVSQRQPADRDLLSLNA